MYDTVNFTCPECTGPIEIQSKARDWADCSHFDESEVPLEIAAGLEKQAVLCDNCQVYLRVKLLGAATIPCQLVDGRRDDVQHPDE